MTAAGALSRPSDRDGVRVRLVVLQQGVQAAAREKLQSPHLLVLRRRRHLPGVGAVRVAVVHGRVQCHVAVEDAHQPVRVAWLLHHFPSRTCLSHLFPALLFIRIEHYARFLSGYSSST